MSLKQRSDRQFEEGDFVYLKLQPYRQHLLRRVMNHKISPKFFLPFHDRNQGGECGLQTTATSRRHVGAVQVQPTLPIMDVYGAWGKELIKIIDRRMVKRGLHAMTEVLMVWVNSFPKDATWEPLQQLTDAFPHINP
ncbi:reverse transcriptase [Gossypium australe]|uniref:Reverse transcriptase n=1 Tax=Gossypium australe TaxID=47621 RepID=A0A5B6UX72_9ROSI|nr:reverse transcriptase [Gossypium australe]